jgi:hypothetical protein
MVRVSPWFLALFAAVGCGGSKTDSGAPPNVTAGAGAGGSSGSPGTGGKGGNAGGQSGGRGGSAGRASGGTGTGGAPEAGSSGAGLSEAGAAGEPGAGSVADFCVRFTDEYCAHVAGCDCGAGAEEACRTYFAASCSDVDGLFLQATTAVAAGDLEYHPDRLDDAFAGLAKADATCNGFFIDAGYDAEMAYNFDGLFSGSKTLGEDCGLPVAHKGGLSDCADGLLCRRKRSGDGNWCVALVGEGGACDLSAEPTNLCFVAQRPDSDNEFASSFDTLSCVADGAGLLTGTCQRDLPVGTPCTDNIACESGRCSIVSDTEARCAATLPDGEPCSAARDCESGACQDTDTEMPTCSGLLADGEYCGFSSVSCQSGQCQFLGAGSGTTGGVCGPDLNRASGEACANNFECDESVPLCLAGACRAQVCQSFGSE